MKLSKHYLVLQERSLLLYPNQKRTSRLGGRITLVCLIDSMGEPGELQEYKWLRDGCATPENGRYISRKEELRIMVRLYRYVNLNIKVWAHSTTIVLWEASKHNMRCIFTSYHAEPEGEFLRQFITGEGYRGNYILMLLMSNPVCHGSNQKLIGKPDIHIS